MHSFFGSWKSLWWNKWMKCRGLLEKIFPATELYSILLQHSLLSSLKIDLFGRSDTPIFVFQHSVSCVCHRYRHHCVERTPVTPFKLPSFLLSPCTKSATYFSPSDILFSVFTPCVTSLSLNKPFRQDVICV